MAFVTISSDILPLSTIITLMVFLTVLVLFALHVYKQKRAPSNRASYDVKLPPGPPGLPFLGNVLSVGKAGWFVEQVQKYGDIFTWKMGPMSIVSLHGQALKEALSKGNALSDRAPLPAFYDYIQDRGIVGASYFGAWKKQRGFVSSLMHSYHLGKTAGQEPILEETGKLLEFLREQNGNAFDPGTIFQVATANCICSFVYGHQFDYDNAHITKLIMDMRTCISTLSYMSIGLFIPKLAKVPVIGVGEFFRYFDALRAQQRIEINNHIQTLDKENPRDFIDHYLIEMENNGQKDGFTLDNLEIVLVDLFMAGTETSAGAIYWCILMLLRHPDVQIKVQQELDSVIPAEQELITMEDQSKCPYTQAVIHETLRFASIAPTAVRMCTEDFTVGEYTVPKGSFVMANYLNTHRSPMLWNEPDVFKPERFLSKEEPVRLIKRDFLVAFSTGRRNCLGEKLARSELFVFISNMYRSLDIRVPDGTQTPELAINEGFTRMPKPFKACFVPRKRLNTAMFSAEE